MYYEDEPKTLDEALKRPLPRIDWPMVRPNPMHPGPCSADEILARIYARLSGPKYAKMIRRGWELQGMKRAAFERNLAIQRYFFLENVGDESVEKHMIRHRREEEKKKAALLKKMQRRYRHNYGYTEYLHPKRKKKKRHQEQEQEQEQSRPRVHFAEGDWQGQMPAYQMPPRYDSGVRHVGLKLPEKKAKELIETLRKYKGDEKKALKVLRSALKGVSLEDPAGLRKYKVKNLHIYV